MSHTAPKDTATILRRLNRKPRKQTPSRYVSPAQCRQIMREMMADEILILWTALEQQRAG